MENPSQSEILTPVRGMRDFVGSDAKIFHHVVSVLQSVVERYGFCPIELPLVEFTSLFVRSLGDTSDVVDKEMFTFEDRSGQSISLRPEGTASAVRALLTNKLTQTLPQKWFYCGPMFRYDRPQKGRYRQFYQFGIEHLGAKSPLSDVEAIAAAAEAVKQLGLQGATLFLNSIGDAASRAAYREKLVAYFSAYEQELSSDSQRRLRVNPLRILDSKDEHDQKIAQEAPEIEDSLTPESQHFFAQVQEGLTHLGLSFERDPFLVRGLDYYDHTTFEIKAKVGDDGACLAVVGGGRYDGLVEEMGGPSIPAVGWAFGVDRLMLACTQPPLETPPIAVLFVQENEEAASLLLAQRLHRVVQAPVLLPSDGNLAKRMKLSDKNNALCVLLIGEEEIKTNQIKVKFLRAHKTYNEGQEVMIPNADLENFVTRLYKVSPKGAV